MTNSTVVKLFDDMGGESYDQSNIAFAPITNNLHFLIQLILKELPAKAQVLCVGVGTGAEIIGLASAYKNWSFIGLDPSSSLLETCREKLAAEHLMDRCELFHGYLSEYKKDQEFDAVLCINVMHFIKDIGAREDMYRDMKSRLKPKGHLICAEVSVDFDSADYSGLLRCWQAMHKYGGASDESLSKTDDMLREQLGVLPPKDIDLLISKTFGATPLRFFQSFLISAWHCQRP